ncbi:non-ribosomal peptide synthetase [Micromonospora echinofusca]|uniref:Amino acid adenylation domain-containing protein n=1 Tax=Micromonospora echinofusca TaxID=47858 RepID=A0ABS3VTY1_MICEH|nr:non-ribosomal peptide synthetase [Micromonospora echinofusca]MBO4207984.1 amino acid adenylation domain-containing protein [Micromonospora echinofusca]
MSTSSISRAELLKRRLSGLAAGTGTGIPRASRDGALPLSSAQRRLWVLDRIQPGSTDYLLPVRLRIAGDLDTDAVRRALDEVVARHEVLRTRYPAGDAEPVQLVDPPGPVRLDLVDVRDAGPGGAEEALAELTGRAGAEPFDLATQWPVRALLVRVADEGHVLLLTLHHIAADGWSESVLLSELDQLYRAFVAGRPSPLAPLPVQYADFAAWQAVRLSGARLAGQLDHWRSALAGMTPLALPTDRPRGPVRDSAGAAEPFTVPADLAEPLVRLGRAHGATPFMVLLAAFQVLLARYAGQSDVVVGSPVAGRERAETQELVGLFVNMLVLRTEVARERSFVDLLARVRQTALAAYEHQEVPFERLVDEFEPVRDPSRTPLFQVIFQLETGDPVPAVDGAGGLVPTGGAGGLRAHRERVGWEVAKYDLSLALATRPDGSLVGRLEYATALFDPATVRRMVGHYLRLLAGVVADPDTPVGRLDLLTGPERRRLLVEFSGPGEVHPVGTTLPGAFRARVQRDPDAVAVSGPGGPLSYAELDRRSNRLAHELRARGAGRDTLVGVCLDRGVDLVVALLGVLKAGAGYLPLDPGQPADRLRYIVDDARVGVVVTDRNADERLPTGAVTTVRVDDDRPGWPVTDPVPVNHPDDVAYVIYTSGSTGRPKGVPVSHANVLRLFHSCAADFRFGPDDVWTLFHSYAFDFSVWELWGALLHGGRCVVVPFEVSRSPQDLLDLLVAERVTVLNQTPSAFRGLVEAVVDADLPPDALALRTVVFGGEALDVADLAGWYARFGQDGPRLVNMYGITETTVHVTYRPVLPAEATGGGPRSPIGRALRDLRVYVLDEDLNPVPVGVPGQLYVSGPGLARGYLRRPGLTADRFGPDPYAPTPGARMYRTGDLARWADSGDLEFLGRADDQVKIRGHRIEPGEIEAAVGTHPSVEATVVVAHRRAGERQDRLVAYVVPVGGRHLVVGELRDHLHRTLPAYMVPAVFVPVDRIPVTANGKVDRRALPDPDLHRVSGSDGQVAPRDPVEQLMAETWAAAVGVDTVGVFDNFFALGGDSIRAIRVVGALRRQGIAVTVRDLLLHQTIDDLSRFVATVAPSAADGAEEQRVAPFALLDAADRAALPPGLVDAYPMSMVQAGMVYHMLADADDSPYHNITLFPMVDDAPFDLPALRRAAALLADRHEILRTSFDLSRFLRPMQLVHPDGAVEVGYDDLRGHDPDDVTEIIARFTADTRRSPFDVGRAPMLRFHVHQTDLTRWTFSFIECHAILDGWSHHSLIAELLADYRAIRDGRAPGAPTGHTVRYADFVAAELRAVASPTEQDFWADRLDRFDRVTLPDSWAAGPDSGEQPYKIGVNFADLEPGLRALAATAGVPLKSVLFAAHLTVLSAISGSRRFHSGLVCNGRLETQGGEAVRGMHLNTLPIGVDLTGATWTDLVRQVFAEEVAVWPHRRFPLPEMQRRWGDGSPLVEAAFTYLDFHVLDAGQIETARIVDVSPNEFAVDTWTFPGVLFFAARPDRISRANGPRVADMYRRVLVAMATDPAGPTRGNLLDPAETRQLLAFGTGPRVDHPDACLHELFERQVARTPDAPALRCADGTGVSYAELDARANRLARHLRSLGAGAESRVGVLLRRGPDLVVALLGILKAGAAYLPCDPGHPAARIQALLAGAGADLVVTQAALADRLDGTPVTPVVVDREPTLAGYPAGPLGITTSPAALAYVIYTSGSTGAPKGVMIEHRNLVNYLSWCATAYPPTGGAGSPLYSSVAFDLPVTSLLPALLRGATVTLTDDDGTPGLDGLVAALDQGGFDLLKVTPTHLAILDRTVSTAALPTAAGRIVAGGEELTRDLVARWSRHAPQVRLVNEYGPTETTVGCCWAEWPLGELGPGPLPIGRPNDNTVLRVLDADLALVPVGVTGELYIGGAQVGRGYLGRPDLTAERFVPDPFADVPGARLYRTGDLARYRPDGVLEFRGRADQQVKVRGYRIEPGEVEAALRRHADLADVAVRVHTAPGGDRELVAYLVPASGGPEQPPTVGLADRLAGELPAHLVPAAYVVLDALPLTPSGKLDVRALPDPGDVRRGDRPHLAPRTRTERVLAATLAEVLGLSRVGVDEAFTALGVHSMAVMRIIVRLREEHGLVLPFRDFYRHRTIADLARAVDPGASVGTPDRAEDALLWFRRAGTRPPLFCVYPGGGQWYVHLAEYLPPDRPVAALEWPGLHREVPPPGSVDAVADLFLDRIRAVRPTGPYHLLGWCGAGPVTGELADRLLRAGEQVTCVLLDPALDSHTRRNLWEEAATLAHGEELLARLDRATAPAEIGDLQRRFVEVLERVIDEGTKEPPSPGDTFWPGRLRVWRELTEAMLGHRQRPYPGPMHLLVGDELADGRHEVSCGQSYAQYRDRWTELAPNGLRVHRVAGDHLGVLRPPHVAELARLLERVMARTEGTEGTRGSTAR